MKNRLIVLITSLHFIALCSAQEKPAVKKEEPNTWSSFPSGSWVIQSETQKRGEDMRNSTKKLVKELDHLETFKKENGEFKVVEHAFDQITLGFNPNDSEDFNQPTLTQATLTIEGKTYQCTVETHTLALEKTKGGTVSSVIKFWKCKDVNLPLRTLPRKGPDLAIDKHTLKAHVTFKSEFRDETTTSIITKFNVKKKINGKVVSCCLEEITAKLSEHRIRRGQERKREGSATMKQWLSLDIPGHLYSMEGKGTRSENGVDSKISIKRSIEDFHIAKKK